MNLFKTISFMQHLKLAFIFILLIASTTIKAQHKIIWDMASADTAQQRGLLKQINNVLVADPTVKIEVVYHGNAVYAMLKDTGYHKEQIIALQKKGVVFAACNNSLKSRNIDPSRVMTETIIVPVAILEFVKKQELKWSYIKAGS
jgi:intracellular sulfur oxidation DsrE/DsrF family protein